MTVGLIPWNPTSDFVPRRFGRLFDQLWDESLAPRFDSESVNARSWAPPVDIRETDEGLTLVAEIPGLTKEDINLSVENNVLTLSGERKFEKDVKKESYHRIERTFGTFTRSFTLPTNVKADGVEAAFKDGLLTVTVPKAAEARPRKIAIQ